jgi:hypothetical protein
VRPKALSPLRSASAVHDMNFSAERFVVLATNRIGMAFFMPKLC